MQEEPLEVRGEAGGGGAKIKGGGSKIRGGKGGVKGWLWPPLIGGWTPMWGDHLNKRDPTLIGWTPSPSRRDSPKSMEPPPKLGPPNRRDHPT